MQFNDEKPSLEDIQHHGVKGMRWGVVRPDDSGGGGGAPPPTNRQLNKASKAAANAERNQVIDEARARYAASSRSNYLKAKAQYKVDKKTIGTHAAKQKFNEVKLGNQIDFAIATQVKSGRERTKHILLTAGIITVAAVLGGAAGALEHR